MAAKKSDFFAIAWHGSAGIEQAHSLKDELMQAFEQNSKILLDISQIDDIDITGIQLIIAAHKEAEKLGRQFFVIKNIPKQISDFIALTGVIIDNYTIQMPEENANA